MHLPLLNVCMHGILPTRMGLESSPKQRVNAASSNKVPSTFSPTECHTILRFIHSKAAMASENTQVVPTATSLKDIYTQDALEMQAKRWENLLATFKAEYGHQAHFVSRSPGRVNLIGEVSQISLSYLDSSNDAIYFWFHASYYCGPYLMKECSISTIPFMKCSPWLWRSTYC